MKRQLWKSMCNELKSNYDKSQWVIGEWRKTDCTELCVGFNCSENIIDAMNYVDMEVLALVETRGKTFKSDDKQTSEEMRIIKAYKWTKKESIELAIYAAELVIHIFEAKHPNDPRPRNAIDAAKKYLKTRAAEAADAAAAAARAAAGAAWAADAAAAAAWAAWAAAAGAAWAAADAAARAAAWAAMADGEIKQKCHDWIITRISVLEEIK